MADSPYFDPTYFDPTYFDTGGGAVTTGRGAGKARRRFVRMAQPPEPPDLRDDDLLLLL